jgi:hypothetical protein
MTKDVLGEYPFRIEERFDEMVVHFQSKLNPLGGTVFNLRFKIKDKVKRERIKEIISELSQIDA